jgi:hypothetical protein
MTTPRDPERLIHAFLLEGAEQLQDQVYDAVRADIDQKRQRVVIGPWRVPTVSKLVPIGLGAAAVIAVLFLGSQVIGSPSSNVGGPASQAPASAAPSEAPASAAPASASPSAASLPAALQGRWRAEIAPSVAILEFTAYGNHTIDWLNVGSGRVEVEGDEITFSGSGDPQCPGSGTYRWSIEGDNLHLEPVGTDPCPFRVEWASNRTYTRF